MSSPSDRWAWRLRLFASVDLVGSTAYKSSKTESRSSEWVPTFSEFFRDFPVALIGHYAELPNYPNYCPRPERRLKPWKFLGDEILFEVELSRHEEVAAHIFVLQNAVKQYPGTKWASPKLPLRLKGAAWLAGFPLTNREVPIPDPESNGIRMFRDFIGPSLDLGFRLTRFSQERRLTLSADLALMLLDAADALQWNEQFYPVLHGLEVLKGVLGNEPYPVVFLHADKGSPTREEKLLGVTYHSSANELKTYLREFINERTPKLFLPFIHNDPSGRYAKLPESFEEVRVKVLLEDEQSRGYAEQATKDAPDPTEQPHVPSQPLPTPVPPQ